MLQRLLERADVRRALPAVIAFLLGAQLVAAFTLDDDDARRGRVRAATGTTTTVAEAGSTVPTLAAPDTTVTSAAPTRPTPTASGAAPVAFATPKAGEYAYKVESKSTEDGETINERFDAHLVITEVGGKQRHRLMEQGFLSVVEDIVFRPDGRYVVATDHPGTGAAGGCDVQPDLLTVPNPANVGSTWTFKSSCTVKDDDDPEPYTVEMRGTGRVIGRDRRSVGGRVVDVVHLRFEFADEDPSDGPDSYVSNELYAPSVGLTIEETTHSFGSGEDPEGGRYTYDELSTRRLVSLDPG